MIKWILSYILLVISAFLVSFGLNGLYELGEITKSFHDILQGLFFIYYLICVFMIEYARRLEYELKFWTCGGSSTWI